MEQKVKNELVVLMGEWCKLARNGSVRNSVTRSIEALLDEHIHKSAASDLMNQRTALRRALELVLIFHQGGKWSDRDQVRWQEITGSTEATNKVMCDHVRSVLKPKATGETS